MTSLSLAPGRKRSFPQKPLMSSVTSRRRVTSARVRLTFGASFKAAEGPIARERARRSLRVFRSWLTRLRMLPSSMAAA
jgi:hypothetical protein